MKAIVAEVSAIACVDSHRVYATGISNGGALSHRLACEAADVFAAVAPVSYPIDRDPFSQCQPSRPIAVMHSHGRGDLVVPYDGSLTAPSTPESFAYWATTNGCTGDPEITYESDDSSCETYTSCGAGVSTSLCTIDGGHILYQNNDDVPVAELSWQFLSQYTLP
jgi:polyhydroxybutyrate depolymerase